MIDIESNECWQKVRKKRGEGVFDRHTSLLLTYQVKRQVIGGKHSVKKQKYKMFAEDAISWEIINPCIYQELNKICNNIYEISK